MIGVFGTSGLALLWDNNAGAATSPGPDVFGYTVAPTTNFAFVQITNVLAGSQRVLWFDDDAAFTVTNIGFAFRFYGTNYTNVSFNVNGLVTFGGSSISPSNINLTTTVPPGNLPSIAVLWDDWETKYYGNEDAVYYRTTGPPGSRQFIVQWNKVVPIYGPGIDPVIFEVRLFEGSDHILFSYLDTVVSDDATNPPIASLGIGATVGIRATSGQSNGRNLQWSFNQGVVTNGLNLLFIPTNHPPVASNDVVATSEDLGITFNLLANDSDSDGDIVRFVAASQATKGVVTTNVNGTVNYNPATNFFGADNFTYTIIDGRGGSATGLVSIAISPVNDPPTLDGLSNLSLAEDAGLQLINLTGISSGATNENDLLVVTASSSNPALISLPPISYYSPEATGSLMFAPSTNAFGTATITVTVNDGPSSNNVVDRVFIVTVAPVNDAPVANDDVAVTREDTAVMLEPLLNDSDVEGDALTIVGASVTNGSVMVLGGTNLLFTPETNFYGVVSISYTNSDGNGGLAAAVVRVLVNDPPTLSDIPDQTNNEDVVVGPLGFIMADRETLGDNLILSITSSNTVLVPTNNVVILGVDTNRSLTITPATNCFGTTLITLVLTDEAGLTASDSFLVTVTSVNDAPVANDDVAVTSEDTAVTIDPLVNDSDVDGDALTIVGASVTNGSVMVLGGTNLLFTPETNFYGVVSISYTNSDGNGGVASGVVAITVTSVNDAPVANDDVAVTSEDTAVIIEPLVNDSDVEGNGLTILGATVTNGSVVILGGTNLLYTPDTNFNGVVSISYTNSDGNGGGAAALVTVTVTSVNDAPVANDDVVVTSEDTAVVIEPLINDSDVEGNALAILGASVTNGSVAILGGTNLLFTPETNFNGVVSISYTNSDGSGGMAAAVVTVTVTSVNDVPVANDDAAVTSEDTAVTIDPLVNDSDVDGDLLIIIGASVTNGSVVILGGTNLLFTPETNFYGVVSISYTNRDGNGGGATALVTVTVTSVNDAPLANDDVAITAEDTAVTIDPLANDSDVEGDGLTILGASVTNGSVMVLGGTNLLFTPETNFYGVVSISYTNNDGNGGGDIALVTVTVMSVNDAPVAKDDAAVTSEDAAVVIEPLLNDSDAEGDALTIVGASVTNGSVMVLGGTNLLFTPETNFNGVVSISYTNSDGNGGMAAALVTVTVTSVNDAPVASDDVTITAEDTAVTIDPLVNDSDVEGDALTIVGASVTNGSVMVIGGTNLLFTPETNFYGVVSISYTNSDGSGGMATALVTVTVTSVNDTPVAVADAFDTCIDVSLSLPVAVFLANDQDPDAGDGLVITNVSATSTAGGSVVLSGGNITYTPSTNFNGLDTFIYTLADGQGVEATCPVMVRVWPPFNVISVARQSGGSMLIRVCGSAGTNYLMEATSDFNTWTNLGTMSESGGGLFQFEDTGADGVNARFYRAMSP